MAIKWQPIVKIKGALLFEWYCCIEGSKKKYCKPSLDLDFGYQNNRIISGEISVDLNEFAKIDKLLTTKIKQDKNYFQKFIHRCYHYSESLLTTSKKIKAIKKWSKIENKNLLSLYLKYQDSVLTLVPFLNTILVVDSILKRQITNLFETDLKIKDKNEQDLLISRLVIPKKKSFFVKETEDLLKMALQLQENSRADVSKQIQQYLNKHAWMTSVSYLGQFQTEEDVKKKIKNLLKENPKRQLVQAKEIKREILRNYKKALNQIKKSDRLVNLIDVGREFIYLQTYRLDVFYLAHFYAYPLLEEIGRRFNLKVDDIVYLTGEEIVDLIKGKGEVGTEEIENRKRNYALILEKEKFTLLSGEKVAKVIQRPIKEVSVKGTVANRGRATGIAKLLFGEDDISKINKGDIIVSPMTRPSLTPALIKAAGIITDFGGMLCHAAIVSREFGIPCIVGTNNATKVFKDGDMVELNAYEGIARKVDI